MRGVDQRGRFPRLAFAAGLVFAMGCGPVLPGGGSDNGNGQGDGSGGTDARPAVTLVASNLAPIVGEQILLTCRVSNGAIAESFTFQPELGRLVVDAEQGTASFIVDAGDVGVALAFRCAARNSAGVSAVSNQVTITANPAPAGP